jgi:predicted ArsR family transcriptional regulator
VNIENNDQEEDLAARLKLHSKQLRRTLRFLEQELMVRRYVLSGKTRATR